MVYFILILEFAEVLVLIVVLYFMLRPIVNGAVYFPTSNEHADLVMKLADLRPGQKIADLGSGDGRMVIAFAKTGAEAVGYEVNPWLVWKSNKTIRAAGLSRKAHVFWKSYWREDLSGFDAVYVYGITFIMPRLGKKLRKELRPGARVIANIFEFPDWQADRIEDRIYVYRR